MANALGLGIVFTAKDLTGPGIASARRNFAGLGSAIRGTGRVATAALAAMKVGIGALIAGAAGLAIAFGAAKGFGEFEQSLAGVGGVLQATTQEMLALREAAVEAGIATQFSPTEAVEGLRQLAQQGFNATESIDLLNPALNLAAAGQLSVAQASQVAASTMKVFGLSADEATGAVDKLLRISNVTAIKSTDLQIAIANVARGAIAAKQSLDEMLPTLGLVRNTGVEASVAGTAVSSALQFMAKNAKKFKDVGVAVTDAQGKFRPFLDIVLETQTALGVKFPNDAERAATSIKLFGRFGSTAFNAVGQALESGIRDNEGVLQRGAAAIDVLRKSMEGAGGAAEEFKTRLLDTFEGQKILLGGSIQTLGVVLGESFATALRPFVEGLIGLLNRFIKIVELLPGPVKKAFGALFVGTSIFLALSGVVLITSSAMTLLGISLGGIAVALGSAFVALLPFVAALGVAAAGVAAFKLALDQNLGGLGDFFAETARKGKLAFDALTQLFTQGGFSGAVREELAKAGNEGVENFAIDVFVTVARIKKFFREIATGFGEAIKEAEPAFEAFNKALLELQAAFEPMAVNAKESRTAFARAGDSGRSLGDTLGKVAVAVVKGATAIVKLVTAIKPLVDAGGSLITKLGGIETIVEVVRLAIIGLASAITAKLVVGLVTLVGTKVAFALFAIGTSSAVAALRVGGLTGAIAALKAINMASIAATAVAGFKAMTAAAATTLGTVGALAAAFVAVAAAIDQAVKLFDELGGGGGTTLLRQLKRDLLLIGPAEFEKQLGITVGDQGAAPALATRGPAPTPAAQPLASFAVSQPQQQTIDSSVISAAASTAASAAAAAQPPQMIDAVMQVDGEVLGRVTATVARSDANREAVLVSVEP